VDVDAKQGYTLSVQQTPPTNPMTETTRIDHYLEHLQATYPYLPKSTRYVVSDGFYSKVKWVNGVIALKLDVINAMLIYVMSIQVFRSLSVDIANMTARWI
jgi:hypothetical protein